MIFEGADQWPILKIGKQWRKMLIPLLNRIFIGLQLYYLYIDAYEILVWLPCRRCLICQIYLTGVFFFKKVPLLKIVYFFTW